VTCLKRPKSEKSEPRKCLGLKHLQTKFAYSQKFACADSGADPYWLHKQQTNMKTQFSFTAWCGYKGTQEKTISMSKLKALIRAIRSPHFTHARTRRWCGQEIASIYHRDPKSPCGVLLQIGGDDAVVSFLLRRYKNTSPLSPTEGLCAPSRY
jgi:hypothetical protein